MARLYGLVAREAPRAVIIRRGPSRRTCLIAWDLRRDRFEVGQWLNGRVYENRCDLSPSGERLIYFAGNFAREVRTWTAVSKPPYLTALLFWPKGDAWGGGGLFETEHRIALNHHASERELEASCKPPAALEIVPFGERPGLGEDDPIAHVRLLRDGWRLEAKGTETYRGLKTPAAWTFDEPQVYSRPSPRGGWSLERRLHAIHVRMGPWYLYEFVARRDSGEQRPLGRLDWADWSPRGDLLFARDGRLFRIAWRRLGPQLADAVQLADFNGLKFEQKEAPPAALRW